MNTMPEEDEARGGPRPTNDARLASLLTLMMTCVIVVHGSLSTFGQVNYPFPPVGHALSVLFTVVAGWLFLRIDRQTREGKTRHLWLARGALLVCCLLLLVGIIWSPMIFVAAAALYLGQEGGQQRWMALGMGVVCTFAFLLLSMYFLSYWPDRVALAIMVWFPGLILYVLSRLGVTVRQLELSRAHVTRMEVERERNRISRDLHDILGRSLVAVSLRTQAALRLLDRDIPKVRTQLEEMARTLDSAQTSLRHLSRGSVVVDLATEIDSTRSVLETVHVRFDVSLDDSIDLRDREELCARLLRESVTNMLRHSRPTTARAWLERTDGGIEFGVSNDGRLKDSDREKGTGLEDLRRRMEVAGGRLTALPVGTGSFTVRMWLPASTGG